MTDYDPSDLSPLDGLFAPSAPYSCPTCRADMWPRDVECKRCLDAEPTAAELNEINERLEDEDDAADLEVA